MTTKPAKNTFKLADGANTWLFKSEPDTFSWQQLSDSPQQTTVWEGVRNYQARNRLRDRVRVGDGVLFYHSACARPGIVGVAQISRAAYPDPTQFVPASAYFDPRATPETPRWFAVDVRQCFVFAHFLDRKQLLEVPQLAHLELCRRGSRLSIQEVDRQAWRLLLRLGGQG